MLQRTFSKCDIQLPLYLTYLQTAEEIQMYHNNWLDKLFYILSKSSAGKQESSLQMK